MASDGWFDHSEKDVIFHKINGGSTSKGNNVCSQWKNNLSELIKNC